MSIEKIQKNVTAEIGTRADFRTMFIHEEIMTATTDDGRDVRVVRAATGHPKFQIYISGADTIIRLDIMDVLESLAAHLSETTADGATQKAAE